MEVAQVENHFVLVHGACHGVWCWYKLKPRLELVGNRVIVLELAASDINMKAIQEIHTLDEYSEPLLKLMASLPPNERVILVGHNLGGLNLALAMDKFPEKVSVAVFVTAMMPDTIRQRRAENREAQLQMSAKMNAREQRMEDHLIMSMNMSDLTPMQISYYEDRQRQIVSRDRDSGV